LSPPARLCEKRIINKTQSALDKMEDALKTTPTPIARLVAKFLMISPKVLLDLWTQEEDQRRLGNRITPKFTMVYKVENNRQMETSFKSIKLPQEPF